MKDLIYIYLYYINILNGIFEHLIKLGNLKSSTFCTLFYSLNLRFDITQINYLLFIIIMISIIINCYSFFPNSHLYTGPLCKNIMGIWTESIWI